MGDCVGSRDRWIGGRSDRRSVGQVRAGVRTSTTVFKSAASTLYIVRGWVIRIGWTMERECMERGRVGRRRARGGRERRSDGRRAGVDRASRRYVVVCVKCLRRVSVRRSSSRRGRTRGRRVVHRGRALAAVDDDDDDDDDEADSLSMLR